MLDYQFENHDDPEVDVVAKSLAHVHLFRINHSRINLVEQGH